MHFRRRGKRRATFMHAPQTVHRSERGVTEERDEWRRREGWQNEWLGGGRGEGEGWYFSIARGGNVGVTEERLNWVTRLVSSTRLKHPLAA